MEQAPKALVVEDSGLQADYLELILTNLGIMDVTIAANGINGLECFESALRAGSPYSLVLIDIIMPEMDGQELLKRIRALELDSGLSASDRSIIIMTTALNAPKDMMEAIFTGDCNDYIVKPVIQNDLNGMLIKYGLIG